MSRDEILNHVWSEEEFPTSPERWIISSCGSAQTGRDQSEDPQIIKSVRGVGYQLL